MVHLSVCNAPGSIPQKQKCVSVLAQCWSNVTDVTPALRQQLPNNPPSLVTILLAAGGKHSDVVWTATRGGGGATLFSRRR